MGLNECKIPRVHIKATTSWMSLVYAVNHGMMMFHC